VRVLSFAADADGTYLDCRGLNMADVITLLTEIYANSRYAVAGLDGDRVYYRPVDEPLTAEVIAKHVRGDITVAGYTILDGDVVRYLGWDIDSDDQDWARGVVIKILDAVGLPLAVEYSGSKGYHVMAYLSHTAPASVAYRIAQDVINLLGLPRAGKSHVEGYPKQAGLGDGQTPGGRGRIGSALKLPLGLHPRTRRRAVFVSRGVWEEVDAIGALQTRFALDDLLMALARIKDQAASAGLDEIVALIRPHYDPGKRHDLVLYLAGFLALRGWPQDKTEALIKRLLAGDEEGADRLRAVADTYAKVAAGESVAGYSKLTDHLPAHVVTALVNASARYAAPDAARQIVAIRLGTGASWLKEQDVMRLIYKTLIERGRFLMTREERLYYYDEGGHQVIDCGSRAWERFLFSRFNVALSDPFYARVNAMLILNAEINTERVEVWRDTYFDSTAGVLYVYPGGDIVYRLDGINVHKIYNGEGVFFVTRAGRGIDPDARIVLSGDGSLVWSYLTDDLEFEERDGMTAGGQRALLQAWFLSYFFRSLLPTRPLALFLGPAGSGKTTAARRLLRVIQGLDHNVIDVLDDKPDFLRATLEDNTLIVLDNVEQAHNAWLARALDTLATGSQIELRKLYTTNERYLIRPDVYVALTGVQMPFRKETVFERMLVLLFAKREAYRPSHEIEGELRKNYNLIWSLLLNVLNAIVLEVRQRDLPAVPYRVRMADFARFCLLLQEGGVLPPQEVEAGLAMLKLGQSRALAEAEGSVYPLIMDWIQAEPLSAQTWRFVGELYDELAEFARRTGRAKVFYFRSGLGLRNHLIALEELLARDAGMEMQSAYNPANHRIETQYRFGYRKI
jgi:hypothetical protein